MRFAARTLIFPFAVLEWQHRNLELLPILLQLRHEALCDLPEQHRRGYWLTQMLGQEPKQSTAGRQYPDVPVQIQPVDALHFQGDMTIQQLVKVCHLLPILRNVGMRRNPLSV